MIPHKEHVDKFPTRLLILLVIFSIAMIIWQLILCKNGYAAGDTNTYIRAWERLKTFHPDNMRPPVYPLFIGIIFDLFGRQFGGFLILVTNWTIWVAGCRWSWFIMRYLNVGKITCNIVVILMMIFPGVWVLNNMLQTEGVIIGSIPLLIWQLIRYCETRQSKWILYGGGLLITYVFLKPQFLFLIPLWGIAWIYATYRYRKQRLYSIAIVAAAFLSLGTYQYALYHCYLQKQISTVSTINNYYSMRMAGLIRVEEIEDSIARETMRPYIEADPGTDLPDYYLYWRETWLVSNNSLDEIWKNACRLHPKETCAFIWHRIPQSLNYDIFYTRGHNRRAETPIDIAYHKVLNTEPRPDDPDIVYGKELFKVTPLTIGSLIYPLYGIMTIPFWISWLIMISFTVWYCVAWWKQKHFPVVLFFMAAILWGGYAVAFIGAPCDWGRLVTPYCMILFSTGGILFSNIKKITFSKWVR